MTMDNRCRYCGKYPEVEAWGMCSACQAIEEADAAASALLVEAWQQEQQEAERAHGGGPAGPHSGDRPFARDSEMTAFMGEVE